MGPTWDQFGTNLAQLGPTWGQLGANLGPTWNQLGPAWANLGQLGASLVQTWHNMGQHEPPWDQLGANMGLPKIENLAFRFDRNANFTKWHFSHSPTKIIKKYNLRSLLGRFGKPWKGPGNLLGAPQGEQLGETTPIQQGPARECQKERKGRAQPGQDQPERAKMQDQQKQDAGFM